jgi:DNA-binding IclR family transcriptional regulator
MVKESYSEYKVKSLERALHLLEIMAEEKGEVELQELCKKTHINTTTLYRLLQTLQSRGFVEQNPSTGRYRLGLKLLQLGHAVTNQIELRGIALPFLEKLMEKTGETANLVILDEGEAVYIEKVESPASLRMFYRIGKQAPAHATGVGKVLLAALSSEKVTEIIKNKGLCKLTENTITSPEKLQEELEKIQENGFAIDNEECEVGAKCIAAPIRDYTNQVVAAISISGPNARLSEDRLNELAEVVKDTAYKISENIGYRGKI